MIYLIKKNCLTDTYKSYVYENNEIHTKFDGISIFIYKKNSLGKVIREDWTDNFISVVNDGTFEYEFVTVYRSYQHMLFKGYVWFDKKPYNMECEIELHTDCISYLWNER